MSYFLANIDILVSVDHEAEACDCIAEAMRDLLKRYSPESSIIDWRYSGTIVPEPHSGEGFEYAEPSPAGQEPAANDDWSQEDQCAAFDEGWGIFAHSERGLEIEVLDDPRSTGRTFDAKFSGDNTAEDFVKAKARDGSALHAKACRLVGISP